MIAITLCWQGQYIQYENVEADKQKNKNKKLHTIFQVIRGLLECQHPNEVVNWGTEKKKKRIPVIF